MKPTPRISRNLRRPSVAFAATAPDPRLLVAATLLLGAMALAFAPTADAQVTLYRDVGFRGRVESFDGPVADLGRTSIGNDRASAVDVAPGCTATLYRDVGFRGPAIEVRGSIADLRRTRLGNDRVSSLDLQCGDRGRGRSWGDRDRVFRDGDSRGWGDGGHWGRDRGHWDDDRDARRSDGWRDDRGRYGHRGAGAVVLYRDSGFRAPRLEVRGAVAELGRTPLGNDRLSSISVPRGCSAVLYEDSHFRGRAIVVRDDVSDLRRTPIGNDRVSSIEVRCR